MDHLRTSKGSWMEYLTDCGGRSVFSVPEIADLTSVFLRIWVRQSDSIFFSQNNNRRKKKQQQKTEI